MEEICQGTLIWHEVADQSGRNKKARPLIVLNRDEEIHKNGVVYCLPCSHSSALEERDKWSKWWVELPHQADGHVGTKLKKPTVALCDWPPIEICVRDIELDNVGGVVADALLRHILDHAHSYRDEMAKKSKKRRRS